MGSSSWWLRIIDRDKVLCAASGGGQIAEVKEENEQCFNLSDILFKYVYAYQDAGITLWCQRNGLPPLRFTDLDSAVLPNFVACGRGYFLFQAFFHLDEFWFARIFLFSRKTSLISWLCPWNAKPFTLTRLPESSSVGGDNPSATAVFVSEAHEVIEIWINRDGVASLRQNQLSAQELDSPQVTGMEQFDFVSMGNGALESIPFRKMPAYCLLS